MTPMGPDDMGKETRPNLVAGAIVLLLLVVGAAVGIWLLSGGNARRNGSNYSVYFPGVPQIGASTEVLFQGAHVGEVDGTDPPRVGLQLRVTATLAPELTEVVTLFPGETARLAAAADSSQITIALPSFTLTTIQHSGGMYALRRTGANHWLVDESRSSPHLVVNGQRRKSDMLVVQTGDLLAIDRVLIEWQDVTEYSRVRVRILTDKLRKATGVPDSTPESYLLGPRSSLGLSSLFALGKPTLRLEPGFGRQAFLLGTAGVIAPAPTVDLERSVQGMITYLNSPAALRREPATRFERVVSDLNDGLEQVAQVGTRLQTILELANDVSRQHGGVGMIGRLVLPPTTLGSLDTTVARVAAGTVLFSDTSRSVLARLKLDTLETAVTRAVVSADQTLKRVGGSLDSLNLVISTVRDSLPRILGRTSKFLAQGTGTVKGVQGWIPPVAIAGMALSLAGILKLIGVF